MNRQDAKAAKKGKNDIDLEAKEDRVPETPHLIVLKKPVPSPSTGEG
jgi:hypothetical protein